MKHMRFSYTEANLLPEDHEVNIQYNQFLDIFGEEGNLILLAIKDSTVFTPSKFNLWNSLAKSFDWAGEIALQGEFKIPAKYDHHRSREGVTQVSVWRFIRN